MALHPATATAMPNDAPPLKRIADHLPSSLCYPCKHCGLDPIEHYVPVGSAPPPVPAARPASFICMQCGREARLGWRRGHGYICEHCRPGYVPCDECEPSAPATHL